MNTSHLQMSLYRPLKKRRMADFLKNRAPHAMGASPALHSKGFAKIPSFSLPLLPPLLLPLFPFPRAFLPPVPL